jgi:hypothetical protein
MPLHFTIHDAYGSSRVLEFLDGNPQGLQHRNTVGVLTNAPPFAWQLFNIGNYVGLAALDAAPITISGTLYPLRAMAVACADCPVIRRRPHGSCASYSRNNLRIAQSSRRCLCTSTKAE